MNRERNRRAFRRRIRISIDIDRTSTFSSRRTQRVYQLSTFVFVHRALIFDFIILNVSVSRFSRDIVDSKYEISVREQTTKEFHTGCRSSFLTSSSGSFCFQVLNKPGSLSRSTNRVYGPIIGEVGVSMVRFSFDFDHFIPGDRIRSLDSVQREVIGVVKYFSNGLVKMFIAATLARPSIENANAYRFSNIYFLESHYIPRYSTVSPSRFSFSLSPSPVTTLSYETGRRNPYELFIQRGEPRVTALQPLYL